MPLWAPQSAAEEAASDLEAVTARTLGESYTIDDSLLQYSSGLLRQDVVDETTLEEDLSQQIGLVTQAYSLYVDGELVGATPMRAHWRAAEPAPEQHRGREHHLLRICGGCGDQAGVRAHGKGDEPGVSGGAAVQHEDR